MAWRGTNKMVYDFSAHGKEYEKTLGKSHKYFIQVKCKELLKILRKFGYNPQKVLDLGCGTGEAEEILYKHFDEITGIDSAEGMIDEAKRKKIPNCEFKQADVSKLPLPDKYFDIVFSFCLFHHLPKEKWQLAIEEAVRVSKKSAILLTFEHNPKNPITRHVVSKCPIDEGVVLLSLSQIEELYKKANIQIFEKGFIIFFPRFLSFLHPFERLLYKIPYGGQYYVAGLMVPKASP
jgi:ubiquinone/menaquinone biosynthesis C-methylase UbiE